MTKPKAPSRLNQDIEDVRPEQGAAKNHLYPIKEKVNVLKSNTNESSVLSGQNESFIVEGEGLKQLQE